MKRGFVFLLAGLMALAAGTLPAQDLGTPDTLAMVLVQGPDANASQFQVQVDIYAFNDSDLVGGSSGWIWDNPNLQMDSAVLTSLVTDGWSLVTSAYEDDNINVTNANQRFVLSGASLFGSLAGDNTGRRLWASYYFTLSSWTVNDSIVIDTLSFSPGSAWLFVPDGATSFLPVLGESIGGEPGFGGKLVIFDPNRPEEGDNLTLSTTSLTFNAVEGGANPSVQTFDIGSDGASLDFQLFKDSTWLAVSPDAGMTDETITVSVDITGKPAGVYIDTIEVLSESAQNSPLSVEVTLNIAAAPKYLELTPDTLFFEADEGVADPDTQSFQVSETGGGAIVYTLTETLPWFSLDKADGTTPDNVVVSVASTALSAGTYFDSIIVSSVAADNSPVYEYINLVVTSIENRPPVLDSIGLRMVDEGDTLVFIVTASDSDGTIPLLSAANLPDGAVFTDSSNGIGSFFWIPDFDQEGVYSVTFIASDGQLADSELVEITVHNTNRAPVVDQPPDTLIDECTALVMFLNASDLDGDSLYWALEPITDNMTLIDSNTTATLTFTPDTTQAGTYPLAVHVTDGMDTTTVTFTIEVEECQPTPECVDMLLSDTLFHFVDTLESGAGPSDLYSDTMHITSSGEEFCYSIIPDTIMPGSWLSVSPDSGCTPGEAVVSVTVAEGMAPGRYIGGGQVLGDTTVCEPNPRHFVVILDVVDTMIPPPAEDTLTVATVPSVPGGEVVVPVNFVNRCDLVSILTWLQWTSDYLVLDSVSWTDTRLSEFVFKVDSVSNDSNYVFLWSIDDTAVVAPGYGNFVNLHFTVLPETPAGFYEINLKPSTPEDNPVFSEICPQEPGGIIIPEFLPGGIVVDTTANFVCGYVVDPDGNPIEDATVELWADFPYVAPTLTSSSNGTGVFSFSDFTVVPFDLYAYHEGYYPGLVEDLNFGEIGIMIVLTPIDSVYPTYEWVNFYCNTNTYRGEPLPIGSVVDAYDPDGVHCGSFYVTVPGQYGFMAVYRDDPFLDGDQGAEPGDIIRFYVNGTEAITTGDPSWTTNGDAHEVCLEAGATVTRVCDLFEGWNLVSWNVDHSSDNILDVIGPITDCVELVMGFEQGGLTFDPGLPEFSTLWTVNHLSGYWIKTNCDVTLSVTGAPVPPTTPVPLMAGWNLVSYLPETTLVTADALAAVYDDLVVALGYDGQGLIYQPGQEPFNTLNDMGPCYGYWLKVTRSTDLVYPGTGPVVTIAQKGKKPLQSAAVPGITPTNRWINLYAYDLTLDGVIVKSGATVTAHSPDGALIGRYQMNQDGHFGFMPVYADDEATSVNEGAQPGEQFYLSVNGIKTEQLFVWTSAGDKLLIEGLTSKNVTPQTVPDDYTLHQNYPNPFNPTTNISFNVPVAGKARIDIYNILGRLVATPFDGMARTGHNEVIWDGRNFAGDYVASGIYFYRLTADDYVATRKMTLMK